MGDQCRRQRGLGRETPSVPGDSRFIAAIRILGPAARQIQGAVNQGVPTPGGVGEVHRDLGVLDAPGGAGVLALHPHGRHTLLHVPSFINHEYGTRVTKGVDDIVTQIITNPVSVPFRP